MTSTVIPRIPDTFANPYLQCPDCEQRVTNVEYVDHAPINIPCRHRTAGPRDTCPSWSPVDGCRCPGGPSSHQPAHRLRNAA